MIRAAPDNRTLPIFGVDVVPPAQVPVERLADLRPRAVPGPGAVRVVLVVREALRIAEHTSQHVLVRPRITLGPIIQLPALVLHAAARRFHGVSNPLVLIVAEGPFFSRALLEGGGRFCLLGGYGGDCCVKEEAPGHRCRAAVRVLGHRSN